MSLTPLILYLIISQALSQSIFINNVPEYTALPSCAEVPLSSIVRDMVDGCGDDKHTTSYSCFCTASSSYYDRVISDFVASACKTDTSSPVSKALDVFASYCKLGTGLIDTATIISNASSPSPTVLISSSTSIYTPVTISGPIPTNTSGASQLLCRTSKVFISALVGLALSAGPSLFL